MYLLNEQLTESICNWILLSSRVSSSLLATGSFHVVENAAQPFTAWKPREQGRPWLLWPHIQRKRPDNELLTCIVVSCPERTIGADVFLPVLRKEAFLLQAKDARKACSNLELPTLCGTQRRCCNGAVSTLNSFPLEASSLFKVSIL